MKTKTIFKQSILLFAVGAMISCGSDDSSDGGGDGNGNGNGGDGVATSITVETSRHNLYVGSSANFTVKDNLGNDVTSTSTISVDGVALPAGSKTFTEVGNFLVTAVNGDLEDMVGESVLAVATADAHTTKVMVEDYTGTWCGWCPRLAGKLDNLALNNADVIPVAVHDDAPFGFSEVDEMKSAFNISGFPSGRINRTIDWNESDSQVLAQLAPFKECGLAIESSVSGQELSVTVKANYVIDAYKFNKLVVYVLEDGLHYDQANYLNDDNSSPWFGAGNPIPNFEHENVARTVLTDVLGDAIPEADTKRGQTYTKSFTYTIPASYNIANLEIVAAVVDQQYKTVVNAQLADVGDDQDFD